MNMRLMLLLLLLCQLACCPADLIADCKKCCVTAKEDTIKYTSALLEVCPFRLK